MAEVIFAKAEKKDAEAVKRKLTGSGAFDKSIRPFSKGKFVFFPVNKKIKLKGVTFILQNIKNREVVPQSKKVGVSFDIVGDIVIIEKPRKLKMQLKEIAKNILSLHKNVRTVAVKEGALSGKFRLRKLKLVTGQKKTETIHKENGCVFKIDVTKAYFSPRLSHERGRLAGLVRPGETVFVPFAGVGPFAIVIAKRHPDARVISNELNPDAVGYLRENIALNKTYNVQVVPGDARNLLKKFEGTADRVIIPLPMRSDQFLDVAFGLPKKGGIVHFYHFSESIDKTVALLQSYSKRVGRKIKVLSTRELRTYSPRIIEAAVDFQVL